MLPLLLAASLWAREADAQTVQPSVSFTEEDYPAYENAGTAKITVRLASIQSTSTIVRISSADNTATASTDDAAGDYVGFENVDLTIPAGTLTASHTIQILQDSQYENGDGLEGEDFHVSVDSVNGDTSLGGAETEVTIIDDEYTACFASKTYLVGEGAGVYSLPIRLSRALPFPVTVTHAVVDYLSEEGVDYEVLKGFHTFKPGSQDGAFEIWIKDDKVGEINELFRITALVPSVPDGEVFCSTDIIIRDNDGVPDSQKRTVSLSKTNRAGEDIVEGADGGLGAAHYFAVEIAAGQATSNALNSLRVCVTSDTAVRSADTTHTAGEDFVVIDTHAGAGVSGCFVSNLEGVLAEPGPGGWSVAGIQAFGDTVHEEPETITVTLEIVDNPDGRLKLGTSTLTYTIRDNDGVPDSQKRTVSLSKTNRAGEDIVEGADGGLGAAHYFAVEIAAGQATSNALNSLRVCVTSDTAVRSADTTHTAGEDFVVIDTHAGAGVSGCFVSNLEGVLAEPGPGGWSVAGIQAFGDTVHEEPETITVTLEIVDNPDGRLKLGTSTLTYTIRDNDGVPDSQKRTVSLSKTNRAGEDIVEGADGGLGAAHYFAVEIAAGQATSNALNSLRVCVTSDTAVRSADTTHTAGEDFVVIDTHAGAGVSGCFVSNLEGVLAEPGPGGWSVAGIQAFGDTVHEEPETITVTLEIVDNPDGRLKLGTSTLTYTIRDNRTPPAATDFKLLNGGRAISINEGKELTAKVVIGKPAAQALPCFTWGNPSVVRDVLFDRGKALDASGCMKSWPGTPPVGYVIMDLYINTNDDSLAGPNPRFDIGLKTTRKDGSAEPGATANSIGVTVVNDDHSEVVMVRPHPAPMAWVEVKEFFDNLSATAEDRKFSDGTFCNAETPGTRTVTAPGGSGSTRTCVKYFARHATHLKWSTGRATPFSYILRAWGPGEGGGRNFVTIAANTGYSAGQTALDQTAFACNSPEQRAREITISVREAADWSNELRSPALAPGSTKFPICAHEMPGRDYTYTDGSSLPVGVRSEPPKDVDQYPATEWSHQELPRAEIVVAESTPYVDIRNARKTKFVKEGRRARFFVELSAEATQDVAVEWRVRPSVEHPRATLGEDVEKASGTLVIAQGETRGEIRVKTYEDSHDDDREKFRVRITSAEGAVIRQQRAHAIIRNDDPMPAAWLARFGRTVAEQALDGIAGRLAANRTAGMQGAIAGQALSFDQATNDSPGSRGAGPGPSHAPGGTAGGTGALALADVAQAFGSHSGYSGAVGIGQDTAGFGSGFDGMQPQSRGMTGREALLGSSFSLTGAADGSGGSMAFWGRAAQGRFDGGEGTFSLDGEVTTGMLGADYARGKWLVGLALAQSTGEGDYRDTGTAPRPGGQGCPQGTGPLCGEAVREGDGSVEASLMAAIPYAALQASERLKLWGAAGYGTGEVTLKTAMGGSYKADTMWSMAAAGLRGDLLAPPAEGSGPALALTSDALWTRTSSEKTRDLAASDSDTTRLRLGLEGSYRMALEGGGHVTPKLEVGARHDGGDAETGFGVEIGGGIAWVDPGLGLSLDVSGRTLIAHGDDDLKDRGYAASLAFDPDPATQRGPSLSLRQEFGGQAKGGLDALFQPAALEDRTGSEATSRWSMEAAYGLPAFGGRWTGSPHVGLGLATGARDYSLGWRLTPAANANAPDVSFGLRATRRESDTAQAEHTVGFEATARW